MKRLLSALLVFLLLAGLTACARPPEDTTPETSDAVFNTMTAEEAVQEMKIGWNLGNTFDAPEGETSWGQPYTTREMVQKIHDLGFNTIRIPVSWHRHVSPAPDYTIDENWLKRVETVVNYALEMDMYVIINSHHDNDLYIPTPENQEQAAAYLSAIWTQIAAHFEYADHHLIFQAMNEPRVTGSSYEWSINLQNKSCMESVEIVSQLNQVVVDAIRATGGRNADRFIIVSPYAATPMATLVDQFQLPEDTAENKLIVSIHAYTPYNLCLNTKSTDTAFLTSHVNEIKSFMKSVNYRYVKQGIPVIIDEMGIIDKKNPEDRQAWAAAYVAAAKEYGMVCCWWDNGAMNSSGENFGILDRRNLEVYSDSRSVYEGLMDGLEEN